MSIQRCLVVVIFAGISLLLIAPSHADIVAEVGVEGSVGVTGAGGGLQGSVGIIASGGVALPHIHECLNAILEVPGCLNEIISSFRSLQPRLLGPRCCDAILWIHANKCLPKLALKTELPFILIKNVCASRAGSSPQPQSPPCKKHDRCKKQGNDD
ncbi:hypothetical protein F511_00904 [Dorcoceras hygrometricum]|nr:hypothetical protein F511_00904 [Dorcoceras hygrometricum]